MEISERCHPQSPEWSVWRPVMRFPQLLFRTRNNAHESFRVMTRRRQQDTGTCCCLLRPSPPELHRCGHLPLCFTLQTGCKQEAAEAPRCCSGDHMPTGTVEGITGDHGGVIYDGQLRRSEQACMQTAILTRNGGLSSLVLTNCKLSPFSCAETKFQVKWQLLRNTIRHGSLFLQFTSIEETCFPSNEQFIDNRSH